MPDDYGGKHLKIWTPATYRIEVEGEGGENLSDHIGGLRVTNIRKKDQSIITTLVGPVRDQAELAGLLNCLYELHLPIRSVKLLTSEDEDREALK
jgi:hypothetical protein